MAMNLKKAWCSLKTFRIETFDCKAGWNVEKILMYA